MSQRKELSEVLARHLSSNSIISLDRVSNYVSGTILLDSVDSLEDFGLVDKIVFEIFPAVYSHRSKYTIRYTIEFGEVATKREALLQLATPKILERIPRDLNPEFGGSSFSMEFERIGRGDSVDIFDHTFSDINRIHNYGQQSIAIIQLALNAIRESDSDAVEINWYAEFCEEIENALCSFASQKLKGIVGLDIEADSEINGNEVRVLCSSENLAVIISAEPVDDDQEDETPDDCYIVVKYRSIMMEELDPGDLQDQILKLTAFNSKRSIGFASIPVVDGKARVVFTHSFILTTAKSSAVAINLSPFINGVAELMNALSE